MSKRTVRSLGEIGRYFIPVKVKGMSLAYTSLKVMVGRCVSSARRETMSNISAQIEPSAKRSIFLYSSKRSPVSVHLNFDLESCFLKGVIYSKIGKKISSAFQFCSYLDFWCNILG